MKRKLDYYIFVLHIQFFLDRSEFQVNQENIHPTLTIVKVDLALSLLSTVPIKQTTFCKTF